MTAKLEEVANVIPPRFTPSIYICCPSEIGFESLRLEIQTET